MKEREMFYGAESNTFRKAFMLRSRETKAEKLLWQRLTKNQIFGVRFKRQHPLAYYIADFYCHKAKLVIELDGEYHDREQQKQYDFDRMRVMNELGIQILRFSDKEIFENLDGVVETIARSLSSFARP